MALTPNTQIAIIDRQIRDWEETAFQAEVAHRVHTRVKSPDSRLDEFMNVMRDAEIALAELRAMRDAIGASGQEMI